MVDRRRKWRAENQDISIREKVGAYKYIINGARGIDYKVNLRRPDCECPDWQDEKPSGGCKHILKLKLERNRIESLPSAKTNFGSPESRSASHYPENWANLRERTLKRDNWECQSCRDKGGSHGSAQLEVHHIIPKSKGGKDDPSNLITVCHSCHEEEHGHSIPAGVSDHSDRVSRDDTTHSGNDSTEPSQNKYVRNFGSDTEMEGTDDVGSASYRSLDDFLDVGRKDSPKENEGSQLSEHSKPAKSTVRFVPEKAPCERCGTSVLRLWIVDGYELCMNCKEW